MLRRLFGCGAPAAADKRNSVDGVVDDGGGGGGGERLALARIQLNSTQHSSEPTNMGDNESYETLELRVPPLPPSYRFKDVILGADHSEDDRVRVEYFINENSFKERLRVYFVKNQRSSLRIRIFNLVIKLLSCVLYIVRVLMDSHPKSKWINSYDSNYTEIEAMCNMKKSPIETKVIDWQNIFLVDRNDWLWISQTTVAIISLAETLLVTYLGYKGNILHQIFSPSFVLELINSVPFVFTIFYDHKVGRLFIPVFLNCWLAKTALDSMLVSNYIIFSSNGFFISSVNTELWGPWLSLPWAPGEDLSSVGHIAVRSLLQVIGLHNVVHGLCIDFLDFVASV